MAVNIKAPRINPLTKFPLHITPPGSASLQSPTLPFNFSQMFQSILGPISVGFAHGQITPISWTPVPYLNKNAGSQSGVATPPHIIASKSKG